MTIGVARINSQISIKLYPTILEGRICRLLSLDRLFEEDNI